MLVYNSTIRFIKQRKDLILCVCPFSLIHALKYLLSQIIVVLQLSLVNLNRTSVTVNSMDKTACVV